MIDIGANLTNKSFEQDLSEVLQRASSKGLEHIVVTGTNIQESQKAIDLCLTYPDLLSCTAGVHPHDAKDVAPDWLERLEQLQTCKQVVALGETGLDFNRNYSPRDTQISVFKAQLELACKLNKPVFIHDRDSNGEMLAILKGYRDKLPAVVIHCFTGSKQELIAYIDSGFYIGITGWVCDERRGKTLQSLLPLIPDAKLMLETDAPWLIPRGMHSKPKIKNRCEPEHLLFIAEKVAALRKQTVQEIQAISTANARLFFDL